MGYWVGIDEEHVVFFGFMSEPGGSKTIGMAEGMLYERQQDGGG